MVKIILNQNGEIEIKEIEVRRNAMIIVKDLKMMRIYVNFKTVWSSGLCQPGPLGMLK